MSTLRPGRILTGVGILAVGTVGGWIVYSNVGIDHNLPLPKALDADREIFKPPFTGPLSYYVDRDAPGRPLVLLHSINAAPSAYEMKPLFDYYRGKRPVYALDLPGFGFSARENRAYLPQLYADAITAFLQHEVGQPADVVALSLSCEFVARAAVAHPDLFTSLGFLAPTGFGRSIGAIPDDALLSFYTVPLWSQPFYDLLTTKASIRLFLEPTFAGEIPEGFASYAYLTSHQPGARHAPFYFVSGKLFTDDVLERFYKHLTQPVVAIYGTDPNVTFDGLSNFAVTRENWSAVQVNPEVRLPHWEELPETVTALEAMWEAT